MGLTGKPDSRHDGQNRILKAVQRQRYSPRSFCSLMLCILHIYVIRTGRIGGLVQRSVEVFVALFSRARGPVESCGDLVCNPESLCLYHYVPAKEGSL